MIDERYSVSNYPQDWFPVGEKNEFRFIVRDCYMGKKGQVVREDWKAGQGHSYVLIGKGEWQGVQPGGPMWGESPTFIHRIAWERI